MGSDTEGADRSKRTSTGAMVYGDYRDNFVLWPGREAHLQEFVGQTYRNQKHKLRPAKSSNSEDALTWSCFDTLRCLPEGPRQRAMRELWSCAFDENAPVGFVTGQVEIGKTYGPHSEQTEVDASVEGEGILAFIEAKLYSSMSLADPPNRKLHDQLARKLRVGIKEAQSTSRAFYFIVLDIAPREQLRGLRPRVSLEVASESNGTGFSSKWQTAFWFSRYKGHRGSVSPLREVIRDIPGVDVEQVARNMGWLTWPAVFKTVLRAVIASR